MHAAPCFVLLRTGLSTGLALKPLIGASNLIKSNKANPGVTANVCLAGGVPFGMLVDLAVGAPRPRIRLPVSIPEDRPVAAAVPVEAADSVTRPFRKVCSTLEAQLAISACQMPLVIMRCMHFTYLHP